MAEYSKANVKLSDIQIKQLETAVKIKTGTTLRTSLKIKLLLTTRQRKRLRNAFNNNLSTVIKLPTAQISKIRKSIFGIIIK